MLDDADLLEGGRVDDMNGLLCGAGRLLITCAGVPGQFAVLTLCRRRDQPTVDGGEDAEEVRPEAHGGGKEREVHGGQDECSRCQLIAGLETPSRREGATRSRMRGFGGAKGSTLAGTPGRPLSAVGDSGCAQRRVDMTRGAMNWAGTKAWPVIYVLGLTSKRTTEASGRCCDAKGAGPPW